MGEPMTVSIEAASLRVGCRVSPDWESDRRPPLARNGAVTTRVVFSRAGTPCGQFAVCSDPVSAASFGREAFARWIPARGTVSDVRAESSPADGFARAGTRWSIGFALDGAPYRAEAIALESGARDGARTIVVSSFEPEGTPLRAAEIAKTLTVGPILSVTRKKGFWNLLAGTLMTAAGLVFTELARESASSTGGAYVAFVGLIAVGIVVFFQGIVRALRGK